MSSGKNPIPVALRDTFLRFMKSFEDQTKEAQRAHAADFMKNNGLRFGTAERVASQYRTMLSRQSGFEFVMHATAEESKQHEKEYDAGFKAYVEGVQLPVKDASGHWLNGYGQAKFEATRHDDNEPWKRTYTLEEIKDACFQVEIRENDAINLSMYLRDKQ